MTRFIVPALTICLVAGWLVNAQDTNVQPNPNTVRNAQDRDNVPQDRDRQDNVRRDTDTRRVDVYVRVQPGVKANQRASEITGMSVRNAAGESLGSINDIVLDVTTGKVRYFAVSYGGFLGLGNKLFAVPPQSFELRQDDNRNNFLVLNLSEEQLKNAPGFDQDRWPDFATDAQWRQRIDTYYDTTGRTDANRTVTPRR